ncbi:MAG: mannose-1-phosphate guanylyltransferase, partial [Deltaproteobacteria bacterium]
MRPHVYAVLLAGGQGSRFWPQSRTIEPKQFLCLHGDMTLFEGTVCRIKPLVSPRNIYVATSELYRSQITEMLKKAGIPVENLICEPEGKNTAPCIAAACRLIALRDKEARICVLPCDHLIRNPGAFVRVLGQAVDGCGDSLVVFGIQPERAATGYGYIKVRKRGKGTGIFRAVERFCEKPDLATARTFLRDGGYYWNSGVFVGAAKVFMEEFRAHQPALYGAMMRSRSLDDIMKGWKSIKPVSFDYGILEKTRRIRMLVARDLGWSDLGSWQAWDELLEKDADGNSIKGDVINVGSTNTTVWSHKRLVAAIGLDDLIVVDTP